MKPCDFAQGESERPPQRHGEHGDRKSDSQTFGDAEYRYWSTIGLSPTDKVHDLQLVSVMQCSLGPLRTCDDFTVQFHGNAIGLHAKLRDEVRQRLDVGTLFLIAIDYEAHENTVNQTELSSRASTLGAWDLFFVRADFTTGSNRHMNKEQIPSFTRDDKSKMVGTELECAPRRIAPQWQPVR
jgi:hypothetical protein